MAESKFGSVAAVGALGYRLPGEERLRGRAYVFERRHGRDDWPEVAVLENCFVPGPSLGGLMAETVAAAGTPDGVTVVVAGRQTVQTTPTVQQASGACIYHRDDSGDEPGPWTLQAAILPDPLDNNCCVPLRATLHASPNGRTTLVYGPVGGGRAHVYERAPGASTWLRSDILAQAFGIGFGTSASLTTIGEHDVLLVSADADSRFSPNGGAGYVFARTQTEDRFVLRAVLGTRDDLTGYYLGAATALSSEGVAVLSTPQSFNEADQGRVYRYDLTELFPIVSAEAPAASGPGLRVSGANPARGATAVSFALAEAASVRLVVLDALGREVAVVADGERSAGAHRVALDVRALPVGVYAVVLSLPRSGGEAGRRREVARVTVVR